MKPTLDTIKCKVFGKKKKLQPKKAKVKCVVKSGEDSIDTCVAKVIKTLDDNGVLKGKCSPQYNML